MYTLYKQDNIFIIILDRVPPSLNKLYYYYYYYHCLPTPTSRVCTGRYSLIWEIHFTSKGVRGTPVLCSMCESLYQPDACKQCYSAGQTS